MGAINEIVDIHYYGLLEEFKSIGIDANIDYVHLRKMWENNNDRPHSCMRDGKYVGFATNGESPMIYIDNEYQRKGIGSLLLKYADINEVWIMKGNTKAENFYKKNGFKPTDSRETTKLGHKITETKWIRDATD